MGHVTCLGSGREKLRVIIYQCGGDGGKNDKGVGEECSERGLGNSGM